MAGSGLGTRRIASLGPCSWTPTPCALVAVSPGPEPVFVATTVAWALPKVPLIAVAAYPHRHYPVVSTSVGRDLDVGGVAGSTRSHTQAEYADRMSGGRGLPITCRSALDSLASAGSLGPCAQTRVAVPRRLPATGW